MVAGSKTKAPEVKTMRKMVVRRWKWWWNVNRKLRANCKHYWSAQTIGAQRGGLDWENRGDQGSLDDDDENVAARVQYFSNGATDRLDIAERHRNQPRNRLTAISSELDAGSECRTSECKSGDTDTEASSSLLDGVHAGHAHHARGGTGAHRRASLGGESSFHVAGLHLFRVVWNWGVRD